MILNTGYQQNVPGKASFDCFIETFNRNVLDKTIQCPKDQQFKLGGGIILKALFCVKIPVVLARANVIIKLDIADNEHLLTLEKNMKEFRNRNLLINTGNGSTRFSTYFTVFSRKNDILISLCNFGSTTFGMNLIIKDCKII